MTTLTKNQNENLFTDLTPATAEMFRGGWALRAYNGFNGKGKRLASANYALPKLKYNNRISSVYIRQGNWVLYDLPNYKGSYTVLKGGGVHNLQYYRWYNGRKLLKSSPNNDVSSIKRIIY